MFYVTNPVQVEAHQIVGVQPQRNADGSLDLAINNGENVVATAEMLESSFTPKPGDYWVIHKSGGITLSAKESFEVKYAPIRASQVEESKKAES